MVGHPGSGNPRALGEFRADSKEWRGEGGLSMFGL